MQDKIKMAKTFFFNLTRIELFGNDSNKFKQRLKGSNLDLGNPGYHSYQNNKSSFLLSKNLSLNIGLQNYNFVCFIWVLDFNRLSNYIKHVYFTTRLSEERGWDITRPNYVSVGVRIWVSHPKEEVYVD